MTQATHTQTVCVPHHRPGLSARLRKLLTGLNNRDRTQDDGPENLAGFSTRYRAEASTTQARRRDISLVAIGYLGKEIW